MEDGVRIRNKRGRPFGHRLSKETKDKIRNGRLGTHHTRKTRDKIYKYLVSYFKKRDSLADSIEQEYSYLSEEAADWVYANRDDIDETEHVMTEKRLSYLNQVELCLGSDIEKLFGHNTTPEFLLLLKEELIEALDKDKLIELHSLL